MEGGRGRRRRHAWQWCWRERERCFRARNERAVVAARQRGMSSFVSAPREAGEFLRIMFANDEEEARAGASGAGSPPV